MNIVFEFENDAERDKLLGVVGYALPQPTQSVVMAELGLKKFLEAQVRSVYQEGRSRQIRLEHQQAFAEEANQFFKKGQLE